MLMELHPGTMRSGFESRWLSQNEGQSSTGRARVSSILSSPNCFIVVVGVTSGGSIPKLLVVSAPAQCSLAQRTTQVIKVVRQLSRAIEILFRGRPVGTTRTLLGSLQFLGETVETALNRSLIGTSALLPAIQRLLAFTNAIRDAVTRERIRSLFQLPRRTLLTLTATGHPLRRLLQILLQTIDAVCERVFAFGQLFATLLGILVLP